MSKKTDVLILSAGRVASDIASIVGDIPSGMVPLNGKPAISWIIDGLLEQGFERCMVTMGFRKDMVEQFLTRAYHNRARVECVSVDDSKPPGNAILEALPMVESSDLLVVLGDTIVRGDIELHGSFVYTSRQFADSTKWCLVKPDAQGMIEILFDKQPLADTLNLSALIGVYYFRDVELLRQVARALDQTSRIQISTLLDRYRVRDPIRCIEQPGWVDIGHLDRYHEAKILLARPREFNRLEFDATRGVITKRSTNTQKLRDEIQWYQHLPADLAVLAPRMLDGRIDQHPYIAMEYYGYPTLAELFVYGAIHPTIWKQIIARLVRVAELFLEHKGSVGWEDYDAMYVKKTQERLTRASSEHPEFQELFSYPTIVINGQIVRNVGELMPFIETMARALYQNGASSNCFLHGDFCFSNVLFDSASGVLRLVDPRGRWGNTPYGDIRYDLAKLRHSVVGSYDHILNDFFTAQRQGNTLSVEVHTDPVHHAVGVALDELLARQWDLDEIKFIEGILFLSMIPLHTERKERQLAMFARGLTLLNEVYEKKKRV